VGVSARGRAAVMAAACALAAGAAGADATAAAQRFREAAERVRAGDALQAIAIYRELAASGLESGSLYWNWAQAASARGEAGEALWAVLRGREVDPGDRSLAREVERLREAANLDPAELTPEPVAVLARVGRRFHLDWLALALALASVAAHSAGRWLPARVWPARAAWAAAALALLAAAVPVAGATARPTAVVVRRGAPLLDGASPIARPVGALRQGEAVPVIERSAAYLRVEDSSGARGWAHVDDVWPLDRRPEP
jgi:hypothetical protein